MRRLVLMSGLLALAGTVLVLILGTTAQGSSSSTFDVIFDDAKGLIAGQQIKVAGAVAGTIENVTVTPNFKARVEGSIDSKFLPFHQNATCTIRPEGLIAENYVECDPGTASSPDLKGNPPTVPVQDTTEPVSLLDLFNIFNLPTRERVQVIIDEFGVGTAGEGDDFNDILLRANPALKLADQAIGILNRQKGQLASIIDATDTIAAQGASHTGDLQNFLTRAASLSQLTADHSSPLSQTIKRLPGMLDAMQPALVQVDTVTRDGTPLLSELRTASPYLNHVAVDLGPFAKAAKPGLADISRAIKTAIPAVHAVTPVLTVMRTYLTKSEPSTKLFAKMLESVQQSGFVENFLSVIYGISAGLAREDSTSHLLSALLVGPGSGGCALYATKPTAGCEAHYAPQAGSGSTAATPSRHSTPTTTAPTTATTKTPATAPRTAPSAATTPTTTTGAPSLGNVLGKLLGGLLSPSGSSSTTAGTSGASGRASGTAGQGLSNLLGYLIK
jgi:ABC-type transporter Mla subunit MlaD